MAVVRARRRPGPRVERIHVVGIVHAVQEAESCEMLDSAQSKELCLCCFVKADAVDDAELQAAPDDGHRSLNVLR